MSELDWCLCLLQLRSLKGLYVDGSAGYNNVQDQHAHANGSANGSALYLWISGNIISVLMLYPVLLQAQRWFCLARYLGCVAFDMGICGLQVTAQYCMIGQSGFFYNGAFNYGTEGVHVKFDQSWKHQFLL